MATLWQKLMQEKADLVAKGKAVLDLAETEGRDLSAEDTAALDAIDVRMAELGPQLASVEAQRERERTMPGAVASPDPIAERAKFPSLGEFCQAVAAFAAGRVDPRLQRVNGDGGIMAAGTGLNEGIPSDGGLLVQTDLANELLQPMYASAAVASRCRRIPISANSNGLKINGVDETSRADSSRWGGILAYWKAEGAAKTASQPHFRQIELSLKKLIGLCYATDEVLQDASALGAIISQG
ncbi:MAG: phage major capsid protein, partial [Anaerolineales bacterium]|nr:phage major capsid protein [Anaerolineales bacterium]